MKRGLSKLIVSSNSMRSRTMTLKVGHAFELPKFYETSSISDTEAALQLGATMFEATLSIRTSDEIKALEERKNAEVAKAKEQAAIALETIQSQLIAAEGARFALQKEQARRLEELYEAQKIAETTARKEERELVTRQLEARIKTLEVELTAIAERNAALLERRNVLESCRDADIRTAEERTKHLLQSTLEEKERAILRSEKTLSTLHESYNRQMDDLRNLSDLIRRKPTNVKTKGSEYEEIFRDKLMVAFGTGDRFSLVDTARNGIGHAGDYLMNWGDNTVLWEVKNYDKPVPTAEVDKFRRDMKENHQVRIGVMVSRYTQITGKVASGNRTVEFVEGKMLIYMSNFEAMSDDMLPSLMLLFRLWWESDKNIEESESKEAMIRTVERLHSASLKTKGEWRLHKARADEMLRWMADTVEDAEERLHNAIKALQGTTITSIVTPDGIFRDSMGDEKMQGWIQLILENTVASDTDSCILNDLADIVGKKKAISRDTAKSHIRAVLLDSAIELQKGKYPARVRGLILKNAVLGNVLVV